MRRSLIAALLATGVLVVASHRGASGQPNAPSTPSTPSTPKRPVVRCAKYTQSRQSDAVLVLRLENDCGFTIDCDLSWRVKCDGGGGNAGGADSARFTLAPSAEDSAVAEASACGDGGWRITNVRWRCQESGVTD